MAADTNTRILPFIVVVPFIGAGHSPHDTLQNTLGLPRLIARRACESVDAFVGQATSWRRRPSIHPAECRGPSIRSTVVYPKSPQITLRLAAARSLAKVIRDNTAGNGPMCVMRLLHHRPSRFIRLPAGQQRLSHSTAPTFTIQIQRPNRLHLALYSMALPGAYRLCKSPLGSPALHAYGRNALVPRPHIASRFTLHQTLRRQHWIEIHQRRDEPTDTSARSSDGFTGLRYLWARVTH
ncbi:hypothetical protein C8R46DRAFT_1236128 [Mycena filopes]|nr:hypothetical protein C8R46DRAFT_1236128 [Mycena filopes]